MFTKKTNTFFLHIPKTGGTWVWRVLEKSKSNIKKITKKKHATYDYIVGKKTSILEKRFSNFQSSSLRFFTVIRNPLTWYESNYKYQKQVNWRKWGEKGNLNYWHPLSVLNTEPIENFNEYMEFVNINYPGFLSHLYYSFTLTSCAHVLKNETLSNDLLELNKLWKLDLNENIIISHKRANSSKSTDIIWTKKNYEDTLRNEINIFKKYNYDLDNRNIVNVE